MELSKDVKTFIVINPFSGRMERDLINQKLGRLLVENKIPHVIIQSADMKNLIPTIQDAVRDGFERVIAVGGDGTISGVAAGLVNTDIPLVIIPAGTGNILAKDLKIPLEMNNAVTWWIDNTTTKEVDAMQIDEQYYFLNVSVGLSSKSLAKVNDQDKRTFGWLAYFASGLQGLSEVSSHEFRIHIDGELHEKKAVEVFVANSGIVQFRNIRLHPEIVVNDGKLSVCMIQAETALDYFKVASEMIIEQPQKAKIMNCMESLDKIVIEADEELPVQADGDRIGHTPVEIKIVPSAVRFVVPVDAAKRKSPNLLSRRQDSD